MAQDPRGIKRKADDDLDERPAKMSKRTIRRPFHDVLPEKLQAVLAHWNSEAPVTLDNSGAVDRRAELITPPEDRNCAAVYLRPGLPPALPLIAMNQWDTTRVEGGGTQNRVQVYGQGAYEKVNLTGTQLHAEMKILQYLFTAGPYGNNLYIGISKRCCLRCAVVMKIQGFQSRGCSGGLWDAGWAIPAFVRNNSIKLGQFFGAATYAWYADLPLNHQREFLNRLQSLTD